MWNEISEPWKIAFEEAWTAFRNGCTPIGGVLCSPDGTIMLRDHNRSAEKDTINRRISHAEANILRRTDTDSISDLHTCVLYTTMEPCPMCMGTCVMSNIRHLRYAARDPYCGFTYLQNSEPYFISKHLDYSTEDGDLELVQLTIQSIYELDYIATGKSDKVLVQFDSIRPDAVRAAKAIRANGLHLKWRQENWPVSRVFDEILRIAKG